MVFKDEDVGQAEARWSTALVGKFLGHRFTLEFYVEGNENQMKCARGLEGLFLVGRFTAI